MLNILHPNVEQSTHNTSRRKRHPEFRGPYQQDNVLHISAGAQTRLARFCLWFNMPLFWITAVLLVSEKPFPWLFDVLPWARYTDIIVICILLNILMLLTLTLGLTGAVGYELHWNPYFRAPSLRHVVSKEEEEEAMARVNREGGKQKVGAMVLIRGRL